jgi:hypothetical protein
MKEKTYINKSERSNTEDSTCCFVANEKGQLWNRNRNKLESQKFSQTQYLISFIYHFLFTFYNKFDETNKFFPKDFFQTFFENCAFYGRDTEREPDP